MSRVRVYELAKEAGMNSKVLADKLQERGFDVKGPSSTVDTDTAEKIRRTVLRQANAEFVEKPISADRGPAVVQRKTTVIRRRPRVEAEAPALEQAEHLPEEEQHIPDTTVSTGAGTCRKAAAGHPAGYSCRPACATEQELPPEISHEVIAGIATSPVKKPLMRLSSWKKKSVILRQRSPAPEAQAFETKQFFPERKVKTDKDKEKKIPSRKGLARVVGTIEIPVEEESSAQRFKKKVVKPTGVGKIAAKVAGCGCRAGSRRCLPQQEKRQGTCLPSSKRMMKKDGGRARGPQKKARKG